MNATPEWMKEMNQDDAELDQEDQDYLPPEGEEPQEPEAQEQEGEEPQEQEQQTVPLATLIEERKRLQQQLDEERTRAARFERLEDELRRMRGERLQQQPQAPAQPERPPVDYLEDPKGYVDSTREELIDRLKKLEGTAQQTQQAATVMAMERQIRNALGAAEATYVEQQPDYYEALNHVRAIKARELAATYPQAKPEQIQQILSQQEIAWGAQMLQSGVNPSAQAYKLAQALGYQAKTEQNQGQQKGTNQASAGESGVDRRRLQGMGGGQAGRPQSDSELERLMDGSPDEFDQAMAELFGKQRR